MDFKTFILLIVAITVICNVQSSTTKHIHRKNDSSESVDENECTICTETTPTPTCTPTPPTCTPPPPTHPTPCPTCSPPPSPTPTPCPTCSPPPSPTPTPCPTNPPTEPSPPPCTDPPTVDIPQPYPECPNGEADPHNDKLLPLPKCCQFVHCTNFGIGIVKNCAPSNPPLVFSPCQNRCVWEWEAGNITCDPCTC